MDQDKIQRQQNIKLIVSEATMVFAVVVTVIVLAFLVSGYWINSNFEVERQGMLQINSIPTGANVTVDGESSWLQRTNTSRVLSNGEHTVLLTKEGYDSWTKTINISEGLLYKIHYPRLFLQNREREIAYDAANVSIATVSPDRSKMVFFDSTSKCFVMNLEEEKLRPKEIDITKVLTNHIDNAASIAQIDWSKDNNHILLHLNDEKTNEWIILDIDNVTNSINLTKQFGADFGTVKMLNDSANNLLVLRNGNLHKIDVQAKQISAILAEKIVSFDYHNHEVVIVYGDETTGYAIGMLKLGSAEITKLGKVEAPSKIVISRFYDEKYITVLTGNQVRQYSGENFELISTFELGFMPSIMKVGHGGEFIEMYLDANVATLDMESLTVREWVLPNNRFGWLDDDMIFSVDDGDLYVYDFDGLNQRKIAGEVSSNRPIVITNNKWLYYFSDGDLIREWLIPR